MELITADKFPSNGGWKFRQTQFGGWENKFAMVGFDASVKNIIAERKKNGALSVRYGLSTDYRTVANELIAYNQKIRNLPSTSGTLAIARFTKPPPVTAPRMTGKICIATTCGRVYFPGAQTLFKSIRHNTPCAGIDFKVITADPEVQRRLAPDQCHFVDDTIRARYKNVAYSPLLPAEHYHHSWYRYETFGITGYDRVICFDSDCLCVNDISYLFSEELNQFDIVSVEDHVVSKVFPGCLPDLEGQGANLTSLKKRLSEGKVDIQPALIVANKTVVNPAWYNRLLDYANGTGFTYSIDEGILNDFIYLEKLRIKLLPLEYDYQDMYEIHIPTLPVPTSPIMVHCEASKPFRKQKSELDPRLHKWFDWWWHEQSLG